MRQDRLWANRGMHHHQPPPQAQPPQRNRSAPQMRFSQPPPTFGNFNSGASAGFGGSSGPGCGGGDFWAELAQFGIFPSTSNTSLSTNTTARNSFNSGKQILFTFMPFLLR